MVSLVPGSLVIRVDGPGEDEIRSGLTTQLLAFFGSGVKLTDLPVVVERVGIRVWVIVDMIVGPDGGLRLLVNPEQRNPIAGGGPLGPALRDDVETQLLDFLETR
jgi:hypothetical protein